MSSGGPVAVHQVVATLGYGDAIGNEVLGVQRALRGAGYGSDIFVQTADPRLKACARPYTEMIQACTADVVLLHHFSIGSRASRLAYALPSRMVLVYHNITPPEYFVGVNTRFARLCFRGRRELGAYVDACNLALGDSEFNRQELEALGFNPTGVLPVVPDFSHLDVGPNRFVRSHFDDDRTNILFVGRLIPNKRIEDLIRFFQAYRTLFDPRARLLLVGSDRYFEGYGSMLRHLASRIGAGDVHFAGHVSNEELTAYYDVADLFLCASEHEGFCVPLVEAFYKGVPVLAYAATAVPATLDGGGVLYATRDPVHVAGLIEALVSEDGLRQSVIEAQDAALKRLRDGDFPGTLAGFVEQVRRAPARPPRRVTAGFWHQVRFAERYEELREFRPSLYRALPKEPGTE
jgi:glycosyltransferase involved in cell wall biosynthesis